MINAGFVQNTMQDRAQQDRAVGRLVTGEPVKLTGYLRFPEAAGTLTPRGKYRQAAVVHPRSSCDGARARLGRGRQDVAPFYIDLESPVPESGIPKPGPLEVHLKDDHMQYAITWFGARRRGGDRVRRVVARAAAGGLTRCVGWVRATGRANARPMTGSAKPITLAKSDVLTVPTLYPSYANLPQAEMSHPGPGRGIPRGLYLVWPAAWNVSAEMSMTMTEIVESLPRTPAGYPWRYRGGGQAYSPAS